MNSYKLNCIIKACSITDNIFKQIIKNFKQFKTEKDIEKFIKQKTKQYGCRPSFFPVIATASNAAEIHHKPTNSKLKKGFLVLDLGVKYKGYCSDMTRTIYIGKPSKKEIKYYNLVLNAQLTCIGYSYPGISCNDLDAIARSALQGKHFIHGLGHGVGKKVHQNPKISPNSRDYLKKGIVITIEPGIYFKNKLGIRIEDTIYIGNKPIILTKSTKKLILI